MKIYDVVDSVVVDFDLANIISVNEKCLNFGYENFNTAKICFESREAAVMCLKDIMAAYLDDTEVFEITQDDKCGPLPFEDVEHDPFLFMRDYDFCPLCGCPHDDGGFKDIGGKKYFFCMDCFDLIVDLQETDEYFEKLTLPELKQLLKDNALGGLLDG